MLYLSMLDFRDDAESLRFQYELSYSERKEREEKIRKQNSNARLILLITCTRIEVYSERDVSFESIERALGLNHIKCQKRRRKLTSEEAEKHLFLLSLGIDSPLFGEDLILSQIKEARARAIENKGSSSYLNRLFLASITFSKAMHSKYRIRFFEPEIALKLHSDIGNGKNILVIGSGVLARLIATELLKDNRVKMSLRDISKDFLVPAGAEAISYDDRISYAKGADIIISASSSIYFTIGSEYYDELKGKVIYDLAEPYDVPSIFNPIRLKDLKLELKERAKLLSLLNKETDKALSSFRMDLEMKEEVLRSEDFSLSLLRRLNSVIERLSLTEDDRKSLESAISESAAKAYIESERKIRK